MIIYTVTNIIVTETIFYIAELILKTRNQLFGGITTVVLAFMVLSLSFGGNLVTLFTTMAEADGSFKLSSILLFFANLFYGFIRGTDRISALSKKYGNL